MIIILDSLYSALSKNNIYIYAKLINSKHLFYNIIYITTVKLVIREPTLSFGSDRLIDNGTR